MSPAAAWHTALEAMAIPARIRAVAPHSPHRHSTAVFGDRADEAIARGPSTPSDLLAAEALPPGGRILDVGSGAGAASLVHADDAGCIVAVDTSDELLAAFADRADRIGVDHVEVHGSWPEAAALAGSADLVVCHDVIYNAADLVAFATALDAAATGCVVLQLTAVHPLAWLTPLWAALHGWERPPGPTADDALAVLAGAGIDGSNTRWMRTRAARELDPRAIERYGRMLCVGEDRHAELADLLAAHPPPPEREMVTVSWDPR